MCGLGWTRESGVWGSLPRDGFLTGKYWGKLAEADEGCILRMPVTRGTLHGGGSLPTYGGMRGICGDLDFD